MIKKTIQQLLTLMLISTCASAQISLQATGYKGEVILARYANGKAYPVDTLSADEGKFIYGSQLQKGIYLFLMDKKYVEFPVGADQSFSLSADYMAEDIQNSLTVAGSTDNSIFFDFIRSGSPEEMVRFYNEKSSLLTDEFLKVYMKALTPIIPPKGANDTVSYYYARNRYFDQIDFTKPEILNSPLVAGKLDLYFNKMLVQQPDTVIQQIKKLMDRPMADTVRHSVLGFLLEYAFGSKVMGMEKSFVWLAENYFIDGKCNWLPEKTLKTITEQYQLNRFCLVGNKAFDLKLIDSNLNPLNLYQVNSNYTILLFYDISCGSCKKVVEELNSRYSDLFLKGVEVVALNTETDREKWLSYIEQQKISDWRNVVDPDNSSNFHTLYGIQQTPIIYLLDKQKIIIGKKLTVDQVFQIISTREN